MVLSPTLISSGLLLLSCYALRRYYVSTKRNNHLPPGPTALPFIGNLLDWPSSEPWKTWAEWSRLYGDIIYIDNVTAKVIVINSVDTATALLSDKGAIYSDRARYYLLGELVGWNKSLININDGPQVKASRRLILQQVGSKSAIERFEPSTHAQIRRSFRRVLDDHSPHKLKRYISTLAGANILNITYGYQADLEGDPFLDLMEQVVIDVGTFGLPGSHIVDIFPWIDSLPSWVPGMGYRKIISEFRHRFLESVNLPYKFVQKAKAEGNERPSVVASSLENESMSTEEESILKYTAHILYAGGSDTTVTSTLTFFCIMSIHPEIQAKAQTEIDTAIGLSRLPKYSDKDRLPYTGALLKEVLRWGVVAPFAVPHLLRSDDIHNGYFIPKGSVILPNIWYMSRDPRNYKNPDVFDPTRFLGDNPELDPTTYVFGFGRRICPGRFFADMMLFLNITTALATMNITRSVDANGEEITPLLEYEGLGVLHAKPFSCRIRARSPQALTLLGAEEDE